MACLINVAISESLATRLDKRCTGPVALEYSVSTRSLNSQKHPPLHPDRLANLGQQTSPGIWNDLHPRKCSLSRLNVRLQFVSTKDPICFWPME